MEQVTTNQVKEMIDQLAAMTAAASITPEIVASIFEKMRILNDQEREKVIRIATAYIEEIRGTGVDADKCRTKNGSNVQAKLDTLDEAVIGVPSKLDITPDTTKGYYYGVSAGVLKIFEAQLSFYTSFGGNTSSPIGIDIEEYAGKTIDIALAGNISSSSVRGTVITDASNNSLINVYERDYVVDEDDNKYHTSIKLPNNAKYLYWSCSSSDLLHVKVQQEGKGGLIEKMEDVERKANRLTTTINGEGGVIENIDELKTKTKELDKVIIGVPSELDITPPFTTGYWYSVSNSNLLINDGASSRCTSFGNDRSNPKGYDIEEYVGKSMDVAVTGAISSSSNRSVVITDSGNHALAYVLERNYVLEEDGKYHARFEKIPTNAKYLYWSIGSCDLLYVKVMQDGAGGINEKILKLETQQAKLQPKLQSGINIKTVNGETILGTGNIVVKGSHYEPKEDVEITPEATKGYYYTASNGNLLINGGGTAGSYYTSFGGNDSAPVGIDISEYIGWTVHVVVGNRSTTSARVMAVCDASNKILSESSILEKEYALEDDGKYHARVKLKPGAKYLYWSCNYALEKLVLNDTSGDVAEIDTDSLVKFSLAKRAVRDKGSLKTSPLVWLHFSDLHGDDVALSKILSYYTANSKYIDDIVNTGDVVQYYIGDGTAAKVFASAESQKMLNAIGNHDAMADSKLTQFAEPVDVYNLFIKNYVSKWGVVQPDGAATNGLCYYYKDYTTQKVRLIVLDCMHWSDAQMTWLQGCLDSARTNAMTVVIAVHYPAAYIVGIDKHWHSIDYESLNLTVAHINSGVLAAVDTFKKNGGSFACYLTGHSHLDAFGTLQVRGADNAIRNEYPDQMCITIDTASSENQQNNGRIPVADTNLMTCANIVAIDTYSHLVKIFRYGAEYDRTLRHIGTMCYDYVNNKVVTSS